MVIRRSRNGTRGRFWCFTLNNPTADEDTILSHLVTETSSMRYLIYGREHADRGTYHYQGYCEFNRTISKPTIRALLGGRAHVELRMRTAQEASDYCKKDDDFSEWGTPSPGQGTRSDLIQVQADIDSGMSLQNVSSAHFGTFLRYHRGLMLYISMLPKPRRSPPHLKWMYGPTGSGKTTQISILLDGSNEDEVYYVSTSPTGTWWDGYCGEKTVVLDDLRASWFPHNFILRLFDSIPMTVPSHGGCATLLADTYIITTNNPPHMLYNQDPAGALMRRVTDFATIYHVLPGQDALIVQEPAFQYN